MHPSCFRPVNSEFGRRAEENLKQPFAGGCVNSRAHAGHKMIRHNHFLARTQNGKIVFKSQKVYFYIL